MRLTGTPAARARWPPAPPARGRRRSARSAAPAAARRPASSRRASVVATRLTSVACLLAERVQHAVGLEALVHDRGGRVDRRAQQDREPADVRQRQRAQPALVAVEAERDGRAERAPQQVAVGELDRLAARRWCPRCGSRRAVASRSWPAPAGSATARQARRPARQRLARPRARRPSAMRARSARGQAQVDRHGDRAQQQARVQRLGEARARPGSAIATRVAGARRRAPRARRAPARAAACSRA